MAQPGSLDAPSSPAASSRDPVLGLLLKWTALPLQASVGSKLRIAARADAATDERVRALWISMAQMWTSGTASRTITGNFTHKRYDRLETKGYIKRSSQPPSMQDILYEITDAGKAALRAVGGASE